MGKRDGIQRRGRDARKGMLSQGGRGMREKGCYPGKGDKRKTGVIPGWGKRDKGKGDVIPGKGKRDKGENR